MPKSSKSTLALSTQVAGTIKPKASKHEIVKALALRKHSVLHKQCKLDGETREAAQKELIRLARNVACSRNTIEQIANGGHVHVSTGSRPLRYHTEHHNRYVPDGTIDSISVGFTNVTFKPADFTPEMKEQAAIICRIDKSGTLNVPPYKEIEQEIRESMTGEMSGTEKRVSALLADPEALKVLDKTLARIEQQAAAPVQKVLTAAA